MEEQVGKVWHRFITRAADTQFPEALVVLEAIKPQLSTWYRAMGGSNAVRIDAAVPRRLGQRRSVLQKIAGSYQKLAVASIDEDCLRLPGQLGVFPDPGLNRDLYFWLAALAASGEADSPGGDWLNQNLVRVRKALTSFPGLVRRYQTLAAAHVALRRQRQGQYQYKQPLEKACEEMVQAALANPNVSYDWPSDSATPLYVPLWLYPSNETYEAVSTGPDPDRAAEPGSQQKKIKTKDGHKGERRAMPKEEDGLLATRLESLFSWTEYVGVDRPVDDDDNDDAERIANDMDVISLARDNKTTASRIKFDLDLPAEGEDQLMLEEGVRLPEWDYRNQHLQKDYCSVQTLISDRAEAIDLPAKLHRKARKLKAQFERLRMGRQWYKAQPEGSEIDLDAYLQLKTDQAVGHSHSASMLYRRQNRSQRDLACLLLADISFSTDAYVNDHQRIIDCIQDSLYLFSEALSLTGDEFAIQAFSSRRRSHVRINHVKFFGEAMSPIVRGRIADLSPGYYTRMGAAIRFATEQLVEQPQAQRLLLILTDGKPNDLDRYEGRYGVEDTRQAIIEAQQQGIHPFCVSIDDQANDYLPYIFGKSSYVFVRNVSELPYKLPKLYLKLTS